MGYPVLEDVRLREPDACLVCHVWRLVALDRGCSGQLHPVYARAIENSNDLEIIVSQGPGARYIVTALVLDGDLMIEHVEIKVEPLHLLPERIREEVRLVLVMEHTATVLKGISAWKHRIDRKAARLGQPPVFT